MTKLKTTLVLITLVSSSVVLANTEFKTPMQGEGVLINQSDQSAEQIVQQLNMQSRNGLTENDFFEYK
ncbi:MULTISPECIES: calmodulin [unclassified Pseudoalteromonas]|uniref:calmodulin n=1 Tax=unclassified Pseudoalteromonas TaxID=194690 RepID=UPI000ED49CCE|nr:MULTISPECIES: calmodulin [unclassified Pseudoalteromonas]HAG41114.1 calmodulin [Pseudoalteromonas sp.]|tara:strand:- start:1260 stop:1463 length:204 start_codon:yes stop_codon:yes gene_type:complete